MTAIEVEKLSKSFRTFARREGVVGAVKDLFWRDYRTLRAVEEISFEVAPGELIGFIGPNGAGKSTTIKMLTGILRPTAGSMRVLEFDPFRERAAYTRHIGAVFGQRTQLWWDIALIESLKLLGSIYEVEPSEFAMRLRQLAEILDLEEFLHTPVRKLSLGQRVRGDLAASLIHNPRILFLDEPTIGLDAVVKERIHEFLKSINTEYQTTVILTTHDLNEIEALCSRVLVIDRGRLIFDGSLEGIVGLPGLGKNIVVDFTTEHSAGELNQLFANSIEFSQESGRRFAASFEPDRLPTAEVVRRLLNFAEIADLTLTEPRIEEVVRRIYHEGRV